MWSWAQIREELAYRFEYRPDSWVSSVSDGLNGLLLVFFVALALYLVPMAG